MAQHLELLSATLLAAGPGSTGAAEHATDEELLDVEWPRVSAALGALHVSSSERLSTLTTRAQELDVSVRTEAAAVAATSDDRQALEAVESETAALLPQIQQAERHFQQVEALVRPKLVELETLQSRAAFLEAAVQVEKRSQAARQCAEDAGPSALQAFEDFAAFVGALPREYGAIRRQAERRVDALSADLRRFAVEKLQSALDEIAWPEPLTKQELPKKEVELRDVAAAFASLLALQLSQQQSQGESASADDLWAMECVLEPLLLRFRFHFERPESPTNRLAKPEWYLSHLLEQTRAHTRFLAHILTPELRRRREALHCSDAQILLLRGFVKAANRKLRRDLETLLLHPALLCHTLDEVLLFEQAIDDAVAYGAWANADRNAYPRCIDVFTGSTDVLFAWTSADVEYAHQMLSASLESGSSSAGGWLGDPHDKTEAAWQLEEAGAASLKRGGRLQERELGLAPPVALHFVSLLDFLAQRFALMETEEQRYLYVVQVHLPLLRQFTQICDARGRHQLQRLRAKASGLQSQEAWRALFVVVNALQHVARALAVWEQSSVFLELSRKAARSEATRTEVLRMHVAYSKQVLSSAAQAASAAVLATDEAAAVRQALAGPGAMIGPTAALSAAYSVGSKTMQSLFRRGEDEDSSDVNGGVGAPSVDVAALATLTATSDDQNESRTEKPGEEEDAEALLFSHTVFERQIAELKALALELLGGAKSVIMRTAERDVEAYRSSSLWTEADAKAVAQRLLASREVSSELASSYTLISRVLASAQHVLLPECWPALWKPLAASMDDLLFRAFYEPPVDAEGAETRLSQAGERQFLADMELLATIFSTDAAKPLPQSFLRQTRDLCRLLQLPAAKLREIAKALDDESTSAQAQGAISRKSETAGELEQLTTILEACNVYALTPSQVGAICTRRLDLENRRA